MKSEELKAIVAPFNKISQRDAMSSVYKCMEIGGGVIRACSLYGILEVVAFLGDTFDQLTPGTTVFVNTSAFLTVVNSAPSKQEFEIYLDETSLIWVCGRANGRMALVNIPEGIPYIDDSQIMYAPFPEDLATGLELASLSCDNAAISAIGMYGVVVYTPDIIIGSTDNVTLSYTTISGELIGAPAISTLPPDGVDLLIEVMNQGAGEIGFDDKGWYYLNPGTKCKVVTVPPLKSDIIKIVIQYQSDTMIAPIPNDSVSRFIKRATALSETRKSATVGLSVVNGSLVLSFKEGFSSTDEDFPIVELAEVADLPEITLSAVKVARALTHATEIILDNLARGIIVFRGSNPNFEYIISGSVVTNK